MSVTATTTAKGAMGGREPEAARVVGLLNGGGENALDADAIAAHDGGDFLAVDVEDARAHGLRVLVTELEDVADFNGFADDEFAGTVAFGAGFTLIDAADVRKQSPVKIAQWSDIAQMVVKLVGPADHILTADKTVIGDDNQFVHAQACGVQFLNLYGIQTDWSKIARRPRKYFSNSSATMGRSSDA